MIVFALIATLLVVAQSAVIITRHNRPVALVSPARTGDVHRGAQVGTDRIRPVLKRGTTGRYLAILLEDRGNR